ncbi:HNH endonuclease signature motif containing protein [uncultured Solobacterium sp.]|uniref:HNH endonuclease signature motif containing protein n=1 Tax=uncultured Solobacterium sp. TaxID=747375 RepID=UPI0037DD63DB
MRGNISKVHDIKPFSERRNFIKSNLISLCKSCHARIHVERGIVRKITTRKE